MPYLPVSDEDALARAAALLLGLGFWRAIYPAVVDALDLLRKSGEFPMSYGELEDAGGAGIGVLPTPRQR